MRVGGTYIALGPYPSHRLVHSSNGRDTYKVSRDKTVAFFLNVLRSQSIHRNTFPFPQPAKMEQFIEREMNL